MKSMSSRVLKSVTLVTEPATAPALSAWAGRQVAVNLIGLDEPATEIGLALVRQGVSILRLYDPKQLVCHQKVRSSAPTYRAIVLTHRLAKEPGNPQTRVFGYPFCFGPVEASFPCNLGIVINADDDQRRVCDDCFQAKTPYLTVTYSPEKGEGSVVVHQAQPCLSCVATGACPPQWKRPDYLRERSYRCPYACCLVGE